jgi:hypothetical protein
MDFAALVSDYIANYQDRAQRELRYYAIQRSLTDAIREAALSRLPGGKRHSHQRRIPLHVLQAANSRLQAIIHRLGKAKSFTELHGFIAQQIGPIPGIGDLTVYDIAHRIGAYLSLGPEAIYLHAGTREGARALNLTGETIPLSEVPAELRKLTPAEIEDCFCIYKDALRRGSLSHRPHVRC